MIYSFFKIDTGLGSSLTGMANALRAKDIEITSNRFLYENIWYPYEEIALRPSKGQGLVFRNLNNRPFQTITCDNWKNLIKLLKENKRHKIYYSGRGVAIDVCNLSYHLSYNEFMIDPESL